MIFPLPYAIYDYRQVARLSRKALSPPTPLIDNKLNANLKVLDLLDRFKVQYIRKVHPPAVTSVESSQIRGESLASGAKAMLCELSNKEIIMCVLSAEKKISYSQLKKHFRVKDATLMNVDRLRDCTNCEVGAVPPFGSIFGLKTIVDPSLIVQGERMNFNAGLRTESVNMLVKDYLIIEKPEVVNFSSKS